MNMMSTGMVAQYIWILSIISPLDKKISDRCKPHPGQSKSVSA
jgi:hypothetical protein